MTIAEAHEIADEQIEWWRAAPAYLSPVGMWLALTGEYQPRASEGDVRGFIIGHLIGSHERKSAARGKPQGMASQRFEDDPRAHADHGSFAMPSRAALDGRASLIRSSME